MAEQRLASGDKLLLWVKLEPEADQMHLFIKNSYSDFKVVLRDLGNV